MEVDKNAEIELYGVDTGSLYEWNRYEVYFKVDVVCHNPWYKRIFGKPKEYVVKKDFPLTYMTYHHYSWGEDEFDKRHLICSEREFHMYKKRFRTIKDIVDFKTEKLSQAKKEYEEVNDRVKSTGRILF